MDSKNAVYLCHWNIPKEAIKKDNKIDKIELKMVRKNPFDFNYREVIYFFPWNFASKIKSIQFAIAYSESIGKLYMQFFEVGKILGKRYPANQAIATTSNEKYEYNNNKYYYKFNVLEERNINMWNLYYILLHRI